MQHFIYRLVNWKGGKETFFLQTSVFHTSCEKSRVHTSTKAPQYPFIQTVPFNCGFIFASVTYNGRGKKKTTLYEILTSNPKFMQQHCQL